MSLIFREFDSGAALAEALALEAADHLRSALAQRGQAALALSGGSTPKRFFGALSQQKLAWKQVSATLVDDRWVSDQSDRSNLKLLRENLQANEASGLTLWPLVTGGADPDAEHANIEASLKTFPWPLDFTVLGMGLDGHTASFFPGGDNLQAALDPGAPGRVISMKAEGAGEARITLTLASLLKSRQLYLHIEGEAKRELFEKICRGGRSLDAPVSYAVHQDASPLSVFWAP